MPKNANSDSAPDNWDDDSAPDNWDDDSAPDNWDNSEKENDCANQDPEPKPPEPEILTAPIKQKKKKQALLKMADLSDSLCTDAYGAGTSTAAINEAKVMEEAEKKPVKVEVKVRKEVEDWEDIDETHMDEKLADMQEVSRIRVVDDDCVLDDQGRPIVITIPKLLDYQCRHVSVQPAELVTFRTALVDQFGNIKPPQRTCPGYKRPYRAFQYADSFDLLPTLHQSENAYRCSENRTPTAAGSESKENRAREVKSYLNKMSPEKFETLAEKIASIELTSLEDMTLIIDLVFTKAVTEHNYCEMYSDLCIVLLTRYPVFPNASGEDQTFVRLLLRRCQEEFEALPTTFDTVPDGIADTELYLYKQKERVLGNMKFIGQLFLRRMLSHKVVQEVVTRLIFHTDHPAEHLIECLCILLRNIGSTLESTAAGREHLATFIARMQILLQMEYPKRIKFAIDDVLAFEKNGWVQVVKGKICHGNFSDICMAAQQGVDPPQIQNSTPAG